MDDMENQSKVNSNENKSENNDEKVYRRVLIVVGFCLFAFVLAANIIDYSRSGIAIEHDAKFLDKSKYEFLFQSESDADDTKTVNINTASAAEIAEALPGIGIKKATAIVEYREMIGGFKSVEELLEIKGIGENTIKQIRPYCRVSD